MKILSKRTKKILIFLLILLLTVGVFCFCWKVNSNKGTYNHSQFPSLPPNSKLWWLTDEEINYAYKEIEKELGNSSEIKLVSPSIVRFIQEGGEISEDLKQTKIIFFPINNSEQHETSDSGSHWTLLVYHKNIEEFGHYNSLGDEISNNAKKLIRNFNKSLGQELDKPENHYVEKVRWIPKQTNGADCGVFVIAFTRTLVNRYKEKLEVNGWNKQGIKEKDLIFSISEERKKLQIAGFPKKGSNGGNYDIGDDVEYLESEENRILEWYENPDTPLRKSIEFEWDYNSLGLSCSATKSERARSLQEFSKKIRLLSGVGKIEKEILKKIYKVKKTLKYCSLSPEEYDNSQPPSKYIDDWVRTTDEFNEINNLYKIHFPGK